MDEMAYHVGSTVYTQRALAHLGSYPNARQQGFECCHIDWEGNMRMTLMKSCSKISCLFLKEI